MCQRQLQFQLLLRQQAPARHQIFLEYRNLQIQRLAVAVMNKRTIFQWRV